MESDMARPNVFIVSPAAAEANNGNWHTAARWREFLRPAAEAPVALAWNGEPADALIALHARRSAASIVRFRAAHPRRGLALVLTGTDLYRDLDRDEDAQHSLECASHLVVLQDEALRRLSPRHRAKARVILQSAPALARGRAGDGTRFVAVGHLREEKDPLTLMQAARLLRGEAGLRIDHVGGALDEALAAAARRTMAECPGYRWRGALPHGETREAIAASHALVHTSRIEGGANVVAEAVCSGVPVIASRIDGNVGMLGPGYAGFFPVGDAPALAAAMRRFAHEPAFAATLAAQCAERAPLFTPAAEAAAVRALAQDLCTHAGGDAARE